MGQALRKCDSKYSNPPEFLKCAAPIVGKTCANGCLCDAICEVSKYKKVCDLCHKGKKPSSKNTLTVFGGPNEDQVRAFFNKMF